MIRSVCVCVCVAAGCRSPRVTGGNWAATRSRESVPEDPGTVGGEEPFNLMETEAKTKSYSSIAGRQTGRKTERQADKQADKQTGSSEDRKDGSISAFSRCSSPVRPLGGAPTVLSVSSSPCTPPCCRGDLPSGTTWSSTYYCAPPCRTCVYRSVSSILWACLQAGCCDGVF